MAEVIERAGNVANSMFVSCGIQFRSNILMKVGATIPLHAHSYDHRSMTPSGWWGVVDIAPDGTRKEFQMACKDFKPTRTDIKFEPEAYHIIIPAEHKHEFTLLEGTNGQGEVLCMWAVGADGADNEPQEDRC